MSRYQSFTVGLIHAIIVSWPETFERLGGFASDKWPTSPLNRHALLLALNPLKPTPGCAPTTPRVLVPLAALPSVPRFATVGKAPVAGATKAGSSRRQYPTGLLASI